MYAQAIDRLEGRAEPGDEVRVADPRGNLLGRGFWSPTSAIPVLIVSTKGMETDKAWGMRQGAKGYIVKPPVESDLIERINALLGG